MDNLAAFTKNYLLLKKIIRLYFPWSVLKTITVIAVINFSVHEVHALNSSASRLFNTLDDQNQNLPKAKSLLPTTKFRYETESHRLRIPRYMAYLLENQNFLERFPEYKVLIPDFNKVITAANGHDLEKQPKHIYTKLAHDSGIDYDKLPKDQAAKAKAFRTAFNADGEIKTGQIMRSVGFIDETGNITRSGKLFYTLEAFVDRWDAYKFRAKEFGKNMLRPGDYIRQKLKPSGFSTTHYNLDTVAAMDDFVNSPRNGVNLEKAVGRFTPQAYKRVRNHFRGNDPSFESIQQEQTTKLVAEHNEKIQIKQSIQKTGASTTRNAESRGSIKAAPSTSKIAINGIMKIGVASAVAHAIHEATNPKKEWEDAVGSAASSTWNITSTLTTGGLVNITEMGDDVADRYNDSKVYEEFLNLPLEEQEMIFRGNNTPAMRTVIFLKRPQVTQIQCPAPKTGNMTSQQDPFEFDIYSPERQKIHMKIFFEKNEPMYIIGKLASPYSSETNQIRLSLHSQQACVSLPQYSKSQHTLISKNECTSINSKNLPDLKPEMAQHLNPDFWNETMKTRDWTLKHISQLQNCCKSNSCIKIINNKKNNSPTTLVEKTANARTGIN